MDYRKNFVKAMKLVEEMDQLLANLDQLFQQSVRLSLEYAQQQITKETYLEKIKILGFDRKEILLKYSFLGKRVQEIKDEFGGEIKS